MNPLQWESIVERIDKNSELTRKSFEKLESKKVLVACSGGADSVALAIMFKASGLDFGLAYIDHGINPETQSSEVVVKELGSICDVPFFSCYLDMAEKELVDSNLEATAREKRYSALEEMRTIHGYDLIATAHHLDDFAETFLINLIRGSGSGGASLAESRNNLIRPILHWRKTELIELVRACQISHHEDMMNSDPRFVRNRVRNEAIPLLSDIAGRDVAPLLARAARNISGDTNYLQKLAASIWPKDTATTNDLNGLDPILQVHALREWIQGYPPSTEEMDRILSVVRHEIVSTQISGNRTIRRSGAVLYQDVTSTKTNTNKESK